MRLNKLPILDIVVPSSFMHFISILELVSTFTVALVLMPLSIKSVAVFVDHTTVTLHLVIYELSIVLFVFAGDSHVSPSISLVFNEITYIHITVSVLESSSSPEMTFFELTFVLLATQCVDSVTTFLVIKELSFIDCSIRFFQDTFTMFLSSLEITSILYIFIQHSEFTLSMELIFLEITLVFEHSFEFEDSISYFFPIPEVTAVRSPVSVFHVSMFESILLELPDILVSIAVGKLSVCSSFHVLTHLSFVFGPVGVGNGAIDEVSVLKLSIECTVFLCPDSLAMRTALLHMPLVDLTSRVPEFAKRRLPLGKLPHKSRTVFIVPGALTIRSAQLIDFSLIPSLFSRIGIVVVLLSLACLSHDTLMVE